MNASDLHIEIPIWSREVDWDVPPLNHPLAETPDWISDNPGWLFPALIFWTFWIGYEIRSRKALLGKGVIEQSQDPILFSVVVFAKIIGVVIVFWIAIR